jgi:hypothetical protein
MKAPNLPSFSDSVPVPQVGQRRGSAPSALAGKMWSAEQLVERVEHLGDAQVLDLVVCRVKVVPEVAQHVLPLELRRRRSGRAAPRAGGEAVLDVALEEALEEGRHQPAAILRDQRRLSSRT